VIDRLAKKGLIELIEVQGETSVRKTDLVRLTDTGRDACRLLLGVQPVESQTTKLLKRHKSPEHAMLNLQAGDVLRQCEYQVDLFPARIELENGRHFEPDLVATQAGRTCYVEVERQAHKDEPDRYRKWDTYYAATGGEFFIAVADRKALDSIKGEVMHWAGQRELVLWMCNISQYFKKPAQGAWTYKRGEPRSAVDRV
jgi:hypothetical protein